jgi:hypothetical protein
LLSFGYRNSLIFLSSLKLLLERIPDIDAADIEVAVGHGSCPDKPPFIISAPRGEIAAPKLP